MVGFEERQRRKIRQSLKKDKEEYKIRGKTKRKIRQGLKKDKKENKEDKEEDKAWLARKEE